MHEIDQTEFAVVLRAVIPSGVWGGFIRVAILRVTCCIGDFARGLIFCDVRNFHTLIMRHFLKIFHILLTERADGYTIILLRGEVQFLTGGIVREPKG